MKDLLKEAMNMIGHDRKGFKGDKKLYKEFQRVSTKGVLLRREAEVYFEEYHTLLNKIIEKYKIRFDKPE